MTMGRMSELVGGELRLTAMGLNKQTSDLFRDGQAAHLVIGMMARADLNAGEQPLWALPDPSILIVRHSHDLDSRETARAASWTRETTYRTRWDAGRVAVSMITCPDKTVWERDQDGQKTRRTRVPRDPDEYDGWVSAQLAGLNVSRVVHTRLSDGRVKRRHGAFFRHQRVAFTVTGIVTDPTEFEEQLIRGIGRAKAWGCGLPIVQDAT